MNKLIKYVFYDACYQIDLLHVLIVPNHSQTMRNTFVNNTPYDRCVHISRLLSSIFTIHRSVIWYYYCMQYKRSNYVLLRRKWSETSWPENILLSLFCLFFFFYPRKNYGRLASKWNTRTLIYFFWHEQFFLNFELPLTKWHFIMILYHIRIKIISLIVMHNKYC